MVSEHLDEPDSVTRFIDAVQTQEYTAAAHLLGLSSATLAWERLTAPSPESANPGDEDDVRGRLGWDQLSEEELVDFSESLAKSKAHDNDSLSTRFENPRSWFALRSCAASISAALDERLEPEARVATLPTRSLNAKTLRDPNSNSPVVFFDQGIVGFLLDFSRLLGWALPSLGPDELFNDEALLGLPHSYTMPFEASKLFTGVMTSYIVSGTPAGIGDVKLKCSSSRASSSPLRSLCALIRMMTTRSS